jgi:hypothetical protein
MTSFLNNDDIYRGAIITNLLNNIDTLPQGSESRLIAFDELVTYVTNDALQYILLNNTLKNAVVDKCINIGFEYLTNNNDIYYSDLVTDLITSCTSLLSLLCPKPTITSQEAKAKLAASKEAVEQAKITLQQAVIEAEQAKEALQRAVIEAEQAKIKAQQTDTELSKIKARIETFTNANTLQ